jgi:hypothetical protein
MVPLWVCMCGCYDGWIEGLVVASKMVLVMDV